MYEPTWAHDVVLRWQHSFEKLWELWELEEAGYQLVFEAASYP